LNVGGPARHVVLLDRGLASRGYDTLLVHGSVAPGEAALEHLAQRAGVPTLRVPGLGRDVHLGGDLAALLRLVRIVFRECPDIIHTHTAKAGTLGRIAAFVFNATHRRRHRCLVVHTFHGHVLSGYFGRVANSLIRFAERSLGAVTDCVIAVSPRQQADLVKEFRIVPAARSAVVPLGLDLDELLTLGAGSAELRRECGVPVNAVVIGYVGRFVPIKDIPTLLKAFAIASTRCADLWLVLFGDGPTKPEAEMLVRTLGIAERVRFLGWSEDLRRIYSTIDICALSSINEGTPVAIIEAMAAGKAVIATSVGGVPDVIDNNRTGVLVTDRDVAALTGAIVRLAQNAVERSRMGIAGRQAVAGRYSHHRLLADVDRLYRSALAAKRGSTERPPTKRTAVPGPRLGGRTMTTLFCASLSRLECHGCPHI
jgi:glycosyltransferase involved in cell wall biosynthesis